MTDLTTVSRVCSKCGNPDIVTSWPSGKDGYTALCEICYGDLSRDARTLNKELRKENDYI